MAVSRSNSPIRYQDGVQLDAFGRLRVSEPRLLFSSPTVHDTRADLYDTTLAGAGSVTASLAGYVSLSVGTVSGDKVQRRGHNLHVYRAGQGIRCAMTFALPAAKANQTVEVGFYDGRNLTIGGNSVWGNGVLLRRQGAGALSLRVARKDSTVGSEVAQTSWNIDKFDGAGPSRITIDWTKTQILVVDLQALYVGRVRVGLQVDGVLYLAHEFLHANVEALPYLASANLAPWYSIENTGVVSSGSALLQICAEVSREGGQQELAEVVGVGNEVGSPASIGTALASIFSFRLWQGFPSAQIEVEGLELLNRSTNILQWLLLKNPTLAAGLTWGGAPATGSRMVEISTTKQTVSARGTVLGHGFVGGTTAAARGLIEDKGISDRARVGFGLSGVSDVFVLAGLFDSGASNSVNCAFRLAELE